MPPAVGRMHPSHMSNPFQHLNPQHAVAQSHYPTSTQHAAPAGFTNAPTFGPSTTLNGGISAFNPGSAYGGSAFSSSSSGAFNGSMLHGQGLASVAAQQGFARGAAMQEHTHQEAAAAAAAASLGGKPGAIGRIREVWRHNLDAEMATLRTLIRRYPYVSMDAEFPGIVARPIGNFAGSKAEYHYQTLRCNVDILKPIQVGITLWSADGQEIPATPDAALLAELSASIRKPQAAPHTLLYLPCTWVFNFHFNLDEDMYAESSIDLLKASGVDFQRHAEHGIALDAFGASLTTSGLAFAPHVHWLSFHSGYDFGYLIKLLTADALPKDQHDFFSLVSTFFPKLWDIKFLLRDAQRKRLHGRLSPEGTRLLDALGQKSGLQDLADELACPRVGTPHTAGSDAWLTGAVFWAMRAKIFGGTLDPDLADQIYGLHGVPAPASQQYREEFFAAVQGGAVGGSTPQQQQQQQQQQQATNGTTSTQQQQQTSTLQGGAAGYTPQNLPSTPTNAHAGLSGGGGGSAPTPGPGPGVGHYGGGGGGGGFGNFSYSGK